MIQSGIRPRSKRKSMEHVLLAEDMVEFLWLEDRKQFVLDVTERERSKKKEVYDLSWRKNRKKKKEARPHRC